MKTMSLLLVLAAGFNSCIGNLLLKWSRTSLPPDAGLIQGLASPAFLGGMFFYAVNVVLFAKALDAMDVSVAYPILAGAGFAMLLLASNHFFNEPITLQKTVGIGLIFLGIFISARA